MKKLIAVLFVFAAIVNAQQKSTSAPPPPPAKAPAPKPATPPAGTARTVPARPGVPYAPNNSYPQVPVTRGVVAPRTPNGVTRGPIMPGPGTDGNVPPMTPHPMFGNGRVSPRDRVLATPRGAQVRMRPNNRVGDVMIANRNLAIHHYLNNRGRLVEHTLPNGNRIVVGPRGGFVQQRYLYAGRPFEHRTYYYGGRPYDRFYNRYAYRGAFIEVYRPAVIYRPAFYGWVYNPWPAPVQYVFVPTPGMTYYNGYFAPVGEYQSPSAWMGDYVMANSLNESYSAANAANQEPTPYAQDGSAITPYVRGMVANEVQRQVSIENADAAAPEPAQASGEEAGSNTFPGIARDMQDGQVHTYLAASELDLIDSDGNECSVTEGDVLALSSAPPSDAVAAPLVVMASKGGQECHKGVTVSVSLVDIQEMQNHMRGLVDQGLAELHNRQGTQGLPAMPVSASAPPVRATFASYAPPPDPNVASELKQERALADVAENQTMRDAGQPLEDASARSTGADALPPAASNGLALGQSVEDVMAIEGTKPQIADLGDHQVYFFPDGKKVTIKDGRVINIK